MARTKKIKITSDKRTVRYFGAAGITEIEFIPETYEKSLELSNDNTLFDVLIEKNIDFETGDLLQISCHSDDYESGTIYTYLVNGYMGFISTKFIGSVNITMP